MRVGSGGDGESRPSRPGYDRLTLALVVALGLLISRRPDAFFLPQFYAEDGAVWYQQAYNDGILHSLTINYAGYLQVLPRMVAAVSLLLPLPAAPWLFNAVGFALLLAPVAFLVTRRLDHLAPTSPGKALLGLAYVGLPAATELHVSLTNSQWHLALLAFLVIIARPPARAPWAVFDIATVLLCGLSGPFCLLLTPIAAVRWLQVRRRLAAVLAVLLAACSIVQLLFLSTGARQGGSHLGATASLLVQILAGRVFVSALAGEHGLSVLLTSPAWTSHALPVVALAAGLGLLAVAVVRGGSELRLFLLFGALMTAAGLVSPLAGPSDHAQWPLLLVGAGERYFFIAVLGFLAVLVWLASRPNWIGLRAVALGGLGLFFLVGMPADWTYPPFADTGFGVQAGAFNQLEAGQQMTFQLNPPGWSMTLVKRP